MQNLFAHENVGSTIRKFESRVELEIASPPSSHRQEVVMFNISNIWVTFQGGGVDRAGDGSVFRWDRWHGGAYQGQNGRESQARQTRAISRGRRVTYY